MSTNGVEVYEPSPAEREALAKKFHPQLRWSDLHEHEKQGLIEEWREQQVRKGTSDASPSSIAQTVTRAVSEADFGRLVDAVTKLVQLQPTAATAATKAGAHLALRTVGRVLKPIIAQEQQQRADLQKDLAAMRREWSEHSRLFNNLLNGLLSELCVHKADENAERAQRLDELEEKVDSALAELARR